VIRAGISSIATAYGAERLGFDPRRYRDFCFLCSIDTGCRASPVSYSMGIGGAFSGDEAVGA
jgi:hypothetical protein